MGPSGPRQPASDARLAVDGMEAICAAIRPGARAGDAYRAWHEGAAAAGLADYHRHHCGYLLSIGFPPSGTGGSKVVGLVPGSELEPKVGMAFHARSWFTNTEVVDYFISNTVPLGEDGTEVLTCETPQTLIVR